LRKISGLNATFQDRGHLSECGGNPKGRHTKADDNAGREPTLNSGVFGFG